MNDALIITDGCGEWQGALLPHTSWQQSVQGGIASTSVWKVHPSPSVVPILGATRESIINHGGRLCFPGGSQKRLYQGLQNNIPTVHDSGTSIQQQQPKTKTKQQQDYEDCALTLPYYITALVHNVERISLGSLRQSLKTTVDSLTDPHVILHRLWCA